MTTSVQLSLGESRAATGLSLGKGCISLDGLRVDSPPSVVAGAVAIALGSPVGVAPASVSIGEILVSVAAALGDPVDDVPASILGKDDGAAKPSLVGADVTASASPFSTDMQATRKRTAPEPKRLTVSFLTLASYRTTS